MLCDQNDRCKMFSALVALRVLWFVRRFLSVCLFGYGISIPLKVGGLGALLILIVFSFWSAAFPNSLGDRVDRFFVLYGFHSSPRFRAAFCAIIDRRFHDPLLIIVSRI